MEIQNKISQQVFDKLRTKFKHISLGDAEGNSTTDPSEAVFYNFNYVDGAGEDHGNITCSLLDNVMKIFYSKNITTELKGSELTWWYKFLQDMRKTAMSNLYGFDTHDISRSALNINDIKATVDRYNMQESKMYGSHKSSYQKTGPTKIIVRHNESIDPEIRGARSRKVESLFVETFEGERFKMPFKSLPGARAMAQHISEGGRPYDDIGESIATMVNEIASLRPFVSRNRNAVFEDETTMAMIESAKEYYAECRATLSKLKGKRGYKNYVENFEVTESEELTEEDVAEMKERFTRKRFSDAMEGAMPIVSKAHKLKSMKVNTPSKPSMKPITEFEEWADNITEAGPAQLNDEQKAEIQAFLQKNIEISDETMEALMDYYMDNGEMPYGVAKARDGDPYNWIIDRLDQDFGMNESPDLSGMLHTAKKMFSKKDDDDPTAGALATEGEEKMCSDKCCGHKASECHCPPDCPHCDCNAEQVDEEQIEEVKSGPFNSKMVGRTAKVYGQSDFGDSDYSGMTGTITRASREHTFSQMVPFKVIYTVKFEDGETRNYNREGVRPVKEQPVTEGTWATPQTPEQQERLRELLANPLPFGNDASNATNALYDLIGDDELFDSLADAAQKEGPEADARPAIQAFLQKYDTGFQESTITEGPQLTDNVTNQLLNRLDARFPDLISRHGTEYIYNLVRDEVEMTTGDWPEDEGFGSSDSYGAWKRILSQLGVELDNRGNIVSQVSEDVVKPKATYSDYLEVYKSSDIGGTDEDDDAERMVKSLEKKGKDASTGAAKGALKRMAEQNNRKGLHVAEDMLQLQRDAGIIQ